MDCERKLIKKYRMDDKVIRAANVKDVLSKEVEEIGYAHFIARDKTSSDITGLKDKCFDD